MNTYFFSPTGKNATFLSTGARVVHVKRQELFIVEQDGMANITIMEEYLNQDYDREIVYFFSLPHGAVITGTLSSL